jgi:hypothetical protein
MGRCLRIGGGSAGTHPDICQRDRGAAIAVAESGSGCQEPGPEGAMAWAPAVLELPSARLV